MQILGIASTMIYGATEAAAAAVTALVQANPGLYGQGSEDSFAPREERVRAGLTLLTEHGFCFPYLHHPHPRIEVLGEFGGPPGFAYEQALIPEGLRFSGLIHDTPRQYRPDDRRDWRQFEAARTEADRLGYQFYRAEAPFGAAVFVVHGLHKEPDMTDRLLDRAPTGSVHLYSPYRDSDDPRPITTLPISIRKYMDYNPEFAGFAGFTSGWRSKPQSQWTRWECLQAWSDVRGFEVDGEGGWRLDSEFGMQVLLSDHRTAIVSLIHPDTDRRTFLRFHEAEGQVDLDALPEVFQPEIRDSEGLSPEEARDIRLLNIRPNYFLDPEDWIYVNPLMWIRQHGFEPIPMKRRAF